MPLDDAALYTPAYHGLSRPRRERRDAAAHRQQVLDAAARLFAERGAQAVTMEEIALAAGVGKGTLYRRYTDKGQLVLALMAACVDQLQADLDAALLAEDSFDWRGKSVPALEQLDAVLARLVAWIEEHTEQLGVLSDQAAGDRRGAMLSGPLYQWLHGVLVSLLDRAYASGEIDVDDRVYVADALLATLDIDLYLFQRHERGYAPTRILGGLHRLVAGLRTRC